MPWLEDLVTQLEEDGVGVADWDIFVGSNAAIKVLPTGSAVLQIIETPGSDAFNTQNRTITPAYIEPRAQLTASAKSYPVARAKAQEAYDSLVKIKNTYIDSTWYLWIKPLQEPFDGGPAENKQAQVKFNVTSRKRPTPEA